MNPSTLPRSPRRRTRRSALVAAGALAVTALLPSTGAGAAFVPTDTMPGWLQTIAGANPVGHFVDAMRGLLMGGPVAEPVADTILWMAIFVVVFAPLSLRTYTRRAW